MRKKPKKRADARCLFPALNVIKCAYITYFEYYTVKTVKVMISSSLEMYLSILNFTYSGI